MVKTDTFITGVDSKKEGRKTPEIVTKASRFKAKVVAVVDC